MITVSFFDGLQDCDSFFLLKSWAVLLIVVLVRIGDEILPRFQTPCLLNYQTEKFQKAICSRKSRHRAAYSHVSQPLNPSQGRTGRGRPARAARYRFEPEIVKKAEMQGAVPGCSCLQGFSDDHDDVDQRTRQQWLGRLHLSLFVFSLQFIFGSFGEKKKCLNTPRPRTSWTRSHGLAPRHPHSQPSTLGGGGGWLMLALRRRTISVGLVVVSKNCIFFVSLLLNIAICTIYQLTNYVYYGKICIFAPIILHSMC